MTCYYTAHTRSIIHKSMFISPVSVSTTGRIEASTTYPGLVVQYTLDNGTWMDLGNNTMWPEDKVAHLRAS